MKKSFKIQVPILFLTIGFNSYAQTHVIDNGGTATWYKIGSLSNNGANVSIRMTSTPGYGGMENIKGESWGRVAIGNDADEFNGWFTQIGGSNSTPNALGWVKTGTKAVDVYLYAHDFNRGTLHVFDGYGFTSNFSSTTTDPLMTAVPEQFNFATGNVGIGTSTPSELLHVAGKAKIEGQVELSPASNFPVLKMSRTSGHGQLATIGQIDFYEGAYDNAVSSRISGTRGPGTSGRGELSFSTLQSSGQSLQERMRITRTGDVGIGTTSPNAQLDVSGDTWMVNGNAKITDVGSDRAAIDLFDQDDAEFLRLYNSNEDAYLRVQGTNPGAIRFFPGDLERVYFGSDGNVGIGTSNPTRLLEISGSDPVFKIDATNTSGDAEIFFDTRKDNGGNYNTARIIADGGSGGETSTLNFQIIDGDGSGWNNTLTLRSSAGSDPSGNVGIGTTSPTEKLEVNGTIRSKEVKVEASPWPDYVFKDDYNLPSLEEIERFIRLEKHLPEIPSAREVKQNGIALGEMNALLLKKIEELTLYTIKQSKEIQRLKSENKESNIQLVACSSQLAAILTRLENLEKAQQ